MEEKKKFIHSLVFPTFFLVLIWMIKISEAALEMSFTQLGLFPLEASGLKGILFSPLIHADFKHLFDNSIPLYLLSIAIFYFYRPVAYRVFFLIWFLTGLIVWLTARPAYHIGASGLVYGFASFVFFSGVIRNNIHLLAISLIVVFMYGSLIWGILPYDLRISWESHLVGGVSGLGIALFYRGYGPPSTKKEWPEEDEEEEDEGPPDKDIGAEYTGDRDPLI